MPEIVLLPLALLQAAEQAGQSAPEWVSPAAIATGFASLIATIIGAANKLLSGMKDIVRDFLEQHAQDMEALRSDKRADSAAMFNKLDENTRALGELRTEARTQVQAIGALATSTDRLSDRVDRVLGGDGCRANQNTPAWHGPRGGNGV